MTATNKLPKTRARTNPPANRRPVSRSDDQAAIDSVLRFTGGDALDDDADAESPAGEVEPASDVLPAEIMPANVPTADSRSFGMEMHLDVNALPNEWSDEDARDPVVDMRQVPVSDWSLPSSLLDVSAGSSSENRAAVPGPTSEQTGGLPGQPTEQGANAGQGYPATLGQFILPVLPNESLNRQAFDPGAAGSGASTGSNSPSRAEMLTRLPSSPTSSQSQPNSQSSATSASDGGPAFTRPIVLVSLADPLRYFREALAAAGPRIDENMRQIAKFEIEGYHLKQLAWKRACRGG